jgi:hypothetical protein
VAIAVFSLYLCSEKRSVFIIIIHSEGFMKAFVVAVVFGAVLFLSGCANNVSNEPTAPAGSSLEKTNTGTQISYAYSGFSSGGMQIVRGQMSFVFGESGRVTGRWNFRALVDTTRIGPQHGSGLFTGSLNNGVLTINLNPRVADNNVVLSGRFDRASYAGRWQWIGFPGVINGGTFRAVRIRPTTVAEDFTD